MDTIKMSKKESIEYKSGHCNIGEEEIKKRLHIGYIGLFLSIAFILIAETFQFPPLYKLLLIFPAIYCISGFLQAYHKFCFVYGFLGLFSVRGNRNQVEEKHLRQLDKKKAFWLLVQILVASLIIAILYYVTS